MRVKLGPYKVSAEFWKALQNLPGDNDEQRVMLAIELAARQVFRQKEIAAEAMEHRRAIQKPVGIAGIPNDEPLAGVPNFEIGEVVPLITGPASESPPVIISDVDHKRGVIVMESQ